jgi:lipoprotein-anchoring transpeptidase ErfK/SrfK
MPACGIVSGRGPGLNLAGPSRDQQGKGVLMHKSRIRGAIAAMVALFAATTFAATTTPAAANQFNLFGPLFGYVPTDNGNEVRADLRRRVVDFRVNEAPGSIVVDTANTYLYFVLPGGKAIRYGIGVGREGFTWSGVKNVERKAEWPDWTPPPEMIARSPYLPRFTAGGEGNPLGARALYLSGSAYRIHGTNAPRTIGSRASSGCIRMTNSDVVDLYDRVQVGTKVIVLPAESRAGPGYGERRAGAGLFGLF